MKSRDLKLTIAYLVLANLTTIHGDVTDPPTGTTAKAIAKWATPNVLIGDINTTNGSASKLIFRVSNGDKASIDGSGNLALGMAAAGAKLHVQGGNILLDNNQFLQSKNTEGVIQNIFGLTSGHSLYFGGGSAISTMTWDINGGAAEMFMNSSGQVGIGITDPIYSLDIKTDGALNVRGTNGRIYANKFRPNTGTSVYFGPETPIPVNQVPFRLDVDGMIGIGGQAIALYDAGGKVIRLGDIMSGDGLADNLAFSTRDREVARFNASGYLALGHTDPRYELDVKTDGAINVRGSNGRIYANKFRPNTGTNMYFGPETPIPSDQIPFRLDVDGMIGIGGQAFAQYNPGSKVIHLGDIMSGDGLVDNLTFHTRDREAARIDAAGNFGIGITGPQEKLHVAGNTRIDGNLQVASVNTKVWSIAPDYVFEKDYKLASLENVESFVQKNKHLPEVPSAAEIKAKGLDLAEMNMVLLKKVEELTLHAIRQDKELRKQAMEIKQMKHARD